MKGDPSILRFLLASRDKSADMERSQELLETLVILIVKSVKDPRSVVCKTALMTCADIFKAYGALMVHSIDPSLVQQLLLTASQDKRFVWETVVEGTDPRISLIEDIRREVEYLLVGGRNGGVLELGGDPAL